MPISPSGHRSCPSMAGTASLHPLKTSESFGLEGFTCLPQAVPVKEGEEIWLWGCKRVAGCHHSFNGLEEQYLTDILLSLKHFFHLKVTTPWLYLSDMLLLITGPSYALLRLGRPSTGSQWKETCRKILYFCPFSTRNVSFRQEAKHGLSF